jgi:hypothetical protein
MGQNDRHLREIDGDIIDRHRIAVFQTDPAATGQAGADSAVACVKEDREPRFGEHFIQRIRRAIVREELLQRRMKLEAVDAAGGDQASCFANGLRSARRIDAREGDRDVRMFGRKFGDGVVRDLRSSRQLLVHGEDDAPDAARSIILGQCLPVVGRATLAEVSPGAFIHGRQLACVLEVDVDIDRDQAVDVETACAGHRDEIGTHKRLSPSVSSIEVPHGSVSRAV